jgi:serine phosphatase RsbU (regulator of sigma subunit)
MLGISALKEYLATESDAENPGTVLDRMRDFIKSTLNSSRVGKSAIDDGMDMTICCYDFSNMVLHYAIANQTAILVRDGETIKLKGDSMPVGMYIREKEHFNTYTMPIKKGDMVYAYSDGMQDQLGGNGNRKFLQRNMLAMFLDVCDKSMEQQNTLIEERIISWRGGNPQVDDMTLVGIRV